MSGVALPQKLMAAMIQVTSRLVLVLMKRVSGLWVTSNQRKKRPDLEEGCRSVANGRPFHKGGLFSFLRTVSKVRPSYSLSRVRRSDIIHSSACNLSLICYSFGHYGNSNATYAVTYRQSTISSRSEDASHGSL